LRKIKVFTPESFLEGKGKDLEGVKKNTGRQLVVLKKVGNSDSWWESFEDNQFKRIK
jgi:hypothetical protein